MYLIVQKWYNKFSEDKYALLRLSQEKGDKL